jgi:hypothetical protein
MPEREFPKTDQLRAARSCVSVASLTSAAPVKRRLVTQSDGTDQSDGTSLIVVLMLHVSSIVRSSMLMLDNALRSYRRTSAHTCTSSWSSDEVRSHSKLTTLLQRGLQNPQWLVSYRTPCLTLTEPPADPFCPVRSSPSSCLRFLLRFLTF